MVSELMVLGYFKLANTHEISGYSLGWNDASEGCIIQEFTNQALSFPVDSGPNFN